jgi:hypothetical protein
MISVQNHLQPLSGNKLWFIIFTCSCLAACSPKTGTGKLPQIVTVEKAAKPPVKVDAKLKEADVSLLLPFNLHRIKVSSASKIETEKSALAIDYYQGFKLGLDSVAASTGMNFRLNVLDTRDNNIQITTLLKSGQLSGSKLIVGPVFPDGIRFITNYSIANNIPVVSPLAASHPGEFNNPHLISMVNNIEVHAERIGAYISGKYDPDKTVIALISTRKPDDELLAVPLRHYFQQGKGIRFSFEEYSSVFTMDTKKQPGKEYVVLLTSAERPFVVATIDKLVKMKGAGARLSLFGHPNWLKQNYNTDKLQALNTKITSSYMVDYKSPAVVSFIKKYRKVYNFEPGEYSFKGFDTGLYFARLLAEHGISFLKYLPQEKYKGLQNSFSFVRDEKLGYINTSLLLLEYKNYALNPVE